MTTAPTDGEFALQRLAALVRDAARWRSELDRRQQLIAAQEAELGALETTRQQLAVELEAMRLVIEDREREIARLFAEASKAHRQLNDVWSSFSWRATGPLRRVSARMPAIARGLRGIGQRHPDLWEASVRSIRSAGRLLVSRPPVTLAQAPHVPPAAPILTSSDQPAELPGPRYWAAVHSTSERHESDGLAAELLEASLHSNLPLIACELGSLGAGTSPNERATGSPTAGDHVLFANDIRTKAKEDLLQSFTRHGVAFSVVIDATDIPEPAGVEPFSSWWRTVLTQARCIFVASPIVRDRILRRALLADIYVSATVWDLQADTGERDQPSPSRSMFAAMAASLTEPAAALEQPGRLFIPGIVSPEWLPAYQSAETWCTEIDPQVSILIVNRNSSRLTRACIQQVWASVADIRYEIIIIDSGSDPAECRALSAMGRGVRLLPLGADRFFGEACNIAAERVRAPLLCLLSHSCFGQPGWLETLVRHMGSDPAAGAAGPLLLSPDLIFRHAGGAIDEQGERYPCPVLDGLPPGGNLPQSVDYLPAAALLIRRDAYLRSGGFDLMYEPEGYEDVDLCFKLKALGVSVQSCPSAHVFRAEADGDDRNREAGRQALHDLNHSKFSSRWGSVLHDRSAADLEAVLSQVAPDGPAALVPQVVRAKAALYTPYAITPGGGERFLLTIASELMRDHHVTIVTPQPYSQLRLQSIAHIFGLDLSRCRMQTEADFARTAAPDLEVVLGNYIYPPITPRTPNAVFICQFPFPMEGCPRRIDHGYRAVIAYSDYARAHISAAMDAHQMPHWPIDVVHPPVPQVVPAPELKRPIVLTVGRFFTGGHNKRHDLMIDAFRQLLKTMGDGVEMHLAGSSTPGPEHMRYLDGLMQAAAGLPITFHVNAARDTLEDLYRRASVYWHATGLGGDLAQHPELAEHFGISLVEAMSGECVPLAFNAGGPREIITHGVDGFLYASIEELVTLTAEILQPQSTERRRAIGRTAGGRAKSFTPERFSERVREVLLPSGLA